MANLGSETLCHYSPGVAWGTAVNAAANMGVLPNTIPFLAPQGDLIVDKGIAGFGERQQAYLVRETVEGSIPFTMRYTGAQWRYWAHLFGDDTVTGSYTHTFNWVNESTLFGSMAFEVDNGDIFEYPSVKVRGATITPDGDGLIEISFDVIGDTVNGASDDSLTNKAAGFNALTYTTKALPMPSEQARIRINAQGGGALGSGDVVSVNNYTLTIARELEGDRPTRGASDGSQKRIVQPVRSGNTDVTLSLEFGSYDAVAKFTDFKNQTAYKADLYWTDGTYTFLIELPSLLPMAPESQIEGSSRIPLTWNFMAIEPTAAPTGMTVANIIHSVLTDSYSSSYE